MHKIKQILQFKVKHLITNSIHFLIVIDISKIFNKNHLSYNKMWKMWKKLLTSEIQKCSNI